MFEEYNICPYTGLRSFTEDESIYFKGRDEDIQQATSMLQANKFLMLTGASGDGKSSLVYAGIVPNARAGFLKADYTSWQVADFRPERSPFKNLCSALADALGIQSTSTVESELQHGFSALVDLYKTSDLYLDRNSEDYELLSEDERRAKRNNASNLLIIADQFEEFFTNPENYLRGVPSVEANLTINLLLETVRISLDENLPIFVVFTMRSDFIGQCAAFRGLPEYIGFSQFFVPRLNRKQMQEIIEEPAELNGNEISRRLTERLIHDMDEGLDQLPILQHALNQIWKAADEGKVEMDLIHYAMVGGMAAEELPEEDKVRYEEWFKEMPKSIRDCFKTHGLHNVLDTHANKIYVSAGYDYKKNTGDAIDDEIAHLIIKSTFQCLTKIDHSRAVRNRMSLGEITEIINHPEVNLEMVAQVVKTFREPGNTFIRPFISEEGESAEITSETVLDITHESLIRNWDMLKSWANEEYNRFLTFSDFKQQVDRWLEHDRSRGFLLPVGSLTYFENWYDEEPLNPYWVNRYNEQVTTTAKNINESKEIVSNSEQYLKRSAAKHAITRAFVRFGPRRISLVIGVLLILILSTGFYINKVRQSDDYIMRQLYSEADMLLDSEYPFESSKAFYIILRERREPGSFKTLLADRESDLDRLKLARGVAQDMLLHDRLGNLPLKKESLLYADSMAAILYNEIEDHTSRLEVFYTIQDLSEALSYYLYFKEDKEIRNAYDRVTKDLAEFVVNRVKDPWSGIDAVNFNEGIEEALNNNAFSSEDVSFLIAEISSSDSKISNSLYQPRARAEAGINNLSFLFNGKYQVLIELSNWEGDVNKSLQFLDSMILYHPYYEDVSVDAYTTAGYFILRNNWDGLYEFAVEASQKLEITPYEFLNRISANLGIISQSMFNKWPFYGIFVGDYWYNSILDFMPISRQRDFVNVQLRALDAYGFSEDEKNFQKAIIYKNYGLRLSKKQLDNSSFDFSEEIESSYENSFKHYRLISDQFKEGEIENYFMTPYTCSREEFYKFPGFREFSSTPDSRAFNNYYRAPTFLTFLIDNSYFDELYSKPGDLNLISEWIKMYVHAQPIYIYDFQASWLSYEPLKEIVEACEKNPFFDRMISSYMYLVTANQAFKEDKTELALALVGKINFGSLPQLINGMQPFFWQKTFHPMAQTYAYLVSMNEAKLAHNILQVQVDDKNKSRLYDYAAKELFKQGNFELGKTYLDSANQLIAEMTNSGIGFQNFRKVHSYATAMSDDDNSLSQSKKIAKNLNDFMRTFTYALIVRGSAYRGDLYESYSALPKFASSEEKLLTINQILYSNLYFEPAEEWKVFDEKYNYQYEVVGVY